MKSTTKNTFTQDVLESKKVVLLDVWAPWCPPCRAMNPLLEDIAEDTKDWAEVIKLDADAEAEQAQILGVSSLPTFMVFKNGEMIASGIGATSKLNLLGLMAKAR